MSFAGMARWRRWVAAVWGCSRPLTDRFVCVVVSCGLWPGRTWVAACGFGLGFEGFGGFRGQRTDVRYQISKRKAALAGPDALCHLIPVFCLLFRGPGGDLLSHVLGRSTIGAEGFHGRVREGIGWGPLAITTRSSEQMTDARHQVSERKAALAEPDTLCPLMPVFCPLTVVTWFSLRCVDCGCAGPWHRVGAKGRVFVCVGFLRAHGVSALRFKPVERLGPVSYTCCHASTSGLSTWWSSTALERDLVSRGASRLDAFSGYPVRT